MRIASRTAIVSLTAFLASPFLANTFLASIGHAHPLSLPATSAGPANPIKATNHSNTKALTAPTLVGPSGSSATNMPTYQWDAIANSTWYLLQVSDDTGDKITQWYTSADSHCTPPDTSCDVTPSITVSGTVEWQVRGWNNIDKSGPWSSKLSFDVALAVPAVTSITHPAASTVVGPDPIYEWNPSETASWYQLWVNDPTGNRIKKWYRASELGCSLGVCAVQEGVVLQSGQALAWVRPWNASGNGSWSPVLRFQVSSCPGNSNAALIDTDNDGLLDACDPDDDQDGFQDVIDPAPLNQSIPGDYSTPAKILADPLVQAAISGASNANVPIAIHQGNNPPNILGYWRRDDQSGTFPATSNGVDVGRAIAGAESRISRGLGNTTDTAYLQFTASNPVGYGFAVGTVLEGSGSLYTTYSTSKSTCTQSGSAYTAYFVNISSAQLNAAGNIINGTGLGVNVHTTGQLTSSCANRWVADSETKGSWYVTSVPLSQSALPSELSYMCVDEGNAYVPTESWTRASGDQCSCSQGYIVSCQVVQ